MSRMIRVLMIDVPRLVQDLLERSAVNESDIALVRTEAQPSLAEHDDAPDALIVGEAWARRKKAVVRTLTRWPETRVLMISTNGAAAVLYELQPQKRDLGVLSPAELVNAIRASVGRWDAAVRKL